MADLYIKQLKFEIKNNGVYLSLDSDFRGQASFNDIKDELFKSGIVNADFEKIKEVMASGSTVPVWIGNTFEKYNSAKDKFIHVRISDDGLFGYLTVRFPPDKSLIITENDIDYKLWLAGIRVHVSNEKIEKIVQNKSIVVNELICSGTPPVNGTEAQIVYMVDIDDSSTPLIKDDGKVDYHRTKTITCVQKDQHLAHLIMEKEGKPGISVQNEPIPCTPGITLKLPRGINTYLSPDSCDLYAKMGGHIYKRNGLLNIEQVYVVSQDVDFSTGDVHYNGEVIINGDVKTGFTVETEGNIIVNGSVEGAILKSKSGDINIRGGILGKYKANINAKKNLSAEFIQHAQINAGGNVEVNKYVLDCEIDAEGLVKIPKGQIIGGAVHSERGIIAREIGTPKNIKTRIAMGLSIDTEAWLEAMRIGKKIKDLKKEFDKINDKISFIKVLEQRLKGLNDQKKAELDGLLESKNDIQQRIDELTVEKNSLTKTGTGDNDILEELPFIQANYKMYPGVMLVLNQHVEEINDQLNAVKFLMKPNGVERKAVL